MLLPSVQQLAAAPGIVADRPGSTGGRPLSAAQNPQLVVPGVRCRSLSMC